MAKKSKRLPKSEVVAAAKASQQTPDTTPSEPHVVSEPVAEAEPEVIAEAVDNVPDYGPSEIVIVELSKIKLPPTRKQTRPFDPQDPEYLNKVEYAKANRKWLQNIILRKDGNDLVLVAGRNRYEASKETGWLSIEARVYESMTVVQALQVGLMENIHAKTMTKPQIALAMAEILREDPKASSGKFAAGLNVTKNTVRNILSLNRLVPEASRRTTKGEIPLANAYQLATLPPEIQPDWIDQAAETKTLKFAKAVQEFVKDMAKDTTGTVRKSSKERAKKAPEAIKPLGQTKLEAALAEVRVADPDIMGNINLSYQDGMIDGLLIALGRKPRLPASSAAGFQTKPAVSQE